MTKKGVIMPHYNKLGYVALNVADLERTATFYESIVGLKRVKLGGAGEVFLRCSSDHHNVVLYASSVPGLKRLAFEVQSEADLDEIMAIARAEKISIRELPSNESDLLLQGRTIRMTEPYSGVTLEFYSVMQQFGGQPYEPTVAKIQRLGHVVLKASRWREAVKFYTGALGFRISDIVHERVCFMRCYPNPYHHSLGIGAAAASGLHHVNFMVSEIDDVGRAIYRLKRSGVEIVGGPGRHPPSESIFLYFLDPDGMTVEYSFGMEEFPAEGARKWRILPAIPESVDYWGGDRDPRHGKVGGIERLDEQVS
jgi:2,3-dihydroxy-p-cumate/2,3-dihydroxybenzoate 3,4-dioxygenase